MRPRGRPRRVRKTSARRSEPGSPRRPPSIHVSRAARAAAPQGTSRVLPPLPVRRRTRSEGSRPSVRSEQASLTPRPRGVHHLEQGPVAPTDPRGRAALRLADLGGRKQGGHLLCGEHPRECPGQGGGRGIRALGSRSRRPSATRCRSSIRRAESPLATVASARPARPAGGQVVDQELGVHGLEAPDTRARPSRRGPTRARPGRSPGCSARGPPRPAGPTGSPRGPRGAPGGAGRGHGARRVGSSRVGPRGGRPPRRTELGPGQVSGPHLPRIASRRLDCRSRLPIVPAPRPRPGGESRLSGVPRGRARPRQGAAGAGRGRECAP